MNAADTNSADSSTDAPRRRSRWTDALLTVCGVFVLTVLLMLASALNPNAGLLERLFDRHGVKILAVEVGAILVVAIIVLIVERRETSRRIREREAALLATGELEIERSKSGQPSSEPPSNAYLDQV
ncbi:MAG TPA: hypothetical protein VG055_26845 [Planctomycetaceae bacterium]|jgi:hypothetical protein|nr:hypothetical protein [Planctomycetaceae bacterium]